MPKSDLHARLLTAAGNRSYRHIGEITETNSESVRRYMLGQSPSVEFLTKFCHALSINGQWLLAGIGPMRTGDMRKAALQEAQASELLTAMARTIEVLIDRVDRLELLVQMLEIHQRTTPTHQKATILEEVKNDDRRGAKPGERVKAITDALPKRPPQVDG